MSAEPVVTEREEWEIEYLHSDGDWVGTGPTLSEAGRREDLARWRDTDPAARFRLLRRRIRIEEVVEDE